jgi:membrane-associated protein
MVDLSSVDPSSPGGYAVAFLVPLLDAFFPPVPSESVVIGIGVLASKSFDLRIIPLVLLVCGRIVLRRQDLPLAGTAVRDAGGGPLAVRRAWTPQPGMGRPDIEKIWDRAAHRHQIRARGRTAVTLTAGIQHYDRRRFMLGVGIASMLWTMHAFGIGLVGGHTFEHNTLAAFGLALGVAATVTVLVEIGRRVVSRLSRMRQERSTQP